MTDPRDIALPQSGRIGQATAIEQSRAVAEVYAAVMVARQVPRNEQAARRRMQEACKEPVLAERAFFAFPRAGTTVAGPSIHLARDLARTWGNIQHGVTELERDDDHGQSQMLAFAWDLETNTRVQTIFIVPHKRDKKTGAEKLIDMRDIYENNANAGARRVRECIFAVLPPGYVEEAKTICQRTKEHGGGKPLAERVTEAITRFKELNVPVADIALRLGRQPHDWTAADLAELATIYGSLQRREITREEAFPPAVVSAGEIHRQGTTPSERPEPGSPADVQQVMQTVTPATWHAEGHPGEHGRVVWHPECELCRGDAGGADHYYGHGDGEESCPLCQQEKAWQTEEPS
jgi:hypothetical protein